MADESQEPGKRLAVLARLGAFAATMGVGTLATYFGMDNPAAATALANAGASLLTNLSNDFLKSFVEQARVVPGRNFYQEDALRKAVRTALARLRVDDYGDRWFDPWDKHLAKDDQEHLPKLFHTLEARDAIQLAQNPAAWWPHAEESLKRWAAAERGGLDEYPLPAELRTLLEAKLPNLVDSEFRHELQRSPEAFRGVALDYFDKIVRMLEGNPPQRPKPELDLSSKTRRVPKHDDLLVAPFDVFLGRTAELERLRDFLQPAAPGAHTAARVHIVEGPPGMGKTELCKAALREYLHRKVPWTVYHIACEGVQSAGGLIERMAVAWDVRPEGSDEARKSTVLAQVYAELAVIYLDNLEDALAAEGVRALLGEMGRHPGLRVLASSRQEMAGEARNIDLPPLDIENAVDLFRRHWKPTTASNCRTRPNCASSSTATSRGIRFRSGWWRRTRRITATWGACERRGWNGARRSRRCRTGGTGCRTWR